MTNNSIRSGWWQRFINNSSQWERCIGKTVLVFGKDSLTISLVMVKDSIENSVLVDGKDSLTTRLVTVGGKDPMTTRLVRVDGKDPLAKQLWSVAEFHWQ